MTIAPAERFTLDDLIARAQADPGATYELTTEGIIEVTMTPPKNRHGRISAALMRWFLTSSYGELVRTEVGVATDAPGPYLGGREADLAVFRGVPDDDAHYNHPADLLLVVGITSPSTTHVDFGQKIEEYGASGIPHYWIVDADDTVHLYRLQADRDGHWHGYTDLTRRTMSLDKLLGQRAEDVLAG